MWEGVCEAFQGHSVALRLLQFLHVAFVFELAFRRRSGHIGVNEGLFGPRGPGELIAADLVGLGLDPAVYS